MTYHPDYDYVIDQDQEDRFNWHHEDRVDEPYDLEETEEGILLIPEEEELPL